MTQEGIQTLWLMCRLCQQTKGRGHQHRNHPSAREARDVGLASLGYSRAFYNLFLHCKMPGLFDSGHQERQRTSQNKRAALKKGKVEIWFWSQFLKDYSLFQQKSQRLHFRTVSHLSPTPH
jgi:hypothetical protein